MMRVNSLQPSDASERMHPSVEPVPSILKLHAEKPDREGER